MLLVGVLVLMALGESQRSGEMEGSTGAWRGSRHSRSCTVLHSGFAVGAHTGARATCICAPTVAVVFVLVVVAASCVTQHVRRMEALGTVRWRGGGRRCDWLGFTTGFFYKRFHSRAQEADDAPTTKKTIMAQWQPRRRGSIQPWFGLPRVLVTETAVCAARPTCRWPIRLQGDPRCGAGLASHVGCSSTVWNLWVRE